MNTRAVLAIAHQELVINIRNRWTVIFAAVFAILVVGISYFGIIAEGFTGMQGFTRTSASLLNLVLYIVPLVALTMGTLSFTGDKGSTELLFSQPLVRSEVMLGKIAGLFASMILSTLIGFSIAGVLIVRASGSAGLITYALFVGLTLGLALVFLSIALFVSIASKRKPRAFGISLFLWFFFVLLYDVLTIGGTLLLKGESANLFLFLSLFGNPVDMVRVATLILLDNVTIFGASGAALIRFLGGNISSVLLLSGGLLFWAFTLIQLSRRLIASQDI